MNADTIKIAVRKFGPFETALQKLWDDYREMSACVLKAEMVSMDLDDLHRATLENNGLKNGEWDIAHIVTDWLLEAWEGGALEDLQPYIAPNPPQDFPTGWSNSLLNMQKFDAAIAGLPFHDGPECLIYRKDLFEDSKEQQAFYNTHSKHLQVPKTWDDFRTVARFFHRPKQKLYGTVIAGLPDGHNTVFDFCLQLWARGGNITNDNGGVDINTPSAAEGLAFYRDILRDKKATHPNTMQYESVQAGMAFARGEAALMVNWFGFASMCEVMDRCAVKGKVDIAPIPCTKDNEPTSLNVYWLYTIGSGSRHKQTAYDFIRFAVSRCSDKLLTLEGGIGCRISTWRDDGINAIIPYYHKLEQLHQNARTLPQKKDWSQIARVIDEVVLRAINTDIAIDRLLLEGQQKINRIDITQNNYADRV